MHGLLCQCPGLAQLSCRLHGGYVGELPANIPWKEKVSSSTQSKHRRVSDKELLFEASKFCGGLLHSSSQPNMNFQALSQKPLLYGAFCIVSLNYLPISTVGSRNHLVPCWSRKEHIQLPEWKLRFFSGLLLKSIP